MKPHASEVTKLYFTSQQEPSGHHFRTQGTPKLKRGQGNVNLGHSGMDMSQSQSHRGKGTCGLSSGDGWDSGDDSEAGGQGSPGPVGCMLAPVKQNTVIPPRT